jgi:hypothetical protein
MQFPVDIPKGAIITSAWVEMEAQDSTSTPLQAMRIYLADEDDVSAFTEGLPVLEDRYSWVPTSVNWELNSWITTVDTRYRSPEISGLLQKVVSRDNWGEGNYICFMADLSRADYYQRYVNIKGSDGYDGKDLARLFVEYMTPLPEDTVDFYDYEKDITIDHTKVDADFTDFPVLIDIWDSDLRNSVQADGDDISFAIGDQALHHETELFDIEGNGTHAHLVAWVKVPSVSSSVDTVFTMRYGSRYADAPDSTGVWSNYATVHHLNNDPSALQYDSTSNNHDGTPYGGMNSSDLVSGRVGYGVDFDGSDDVISIGQIHTDDWTGFTMSAWVYRTQDKDARIFSKSITTTPENHIMTLRMDENNHVTARLWTDGPGTGVSYSSTASASNFTWHHIAWSWSASRGSIMAYLDGVLVIDQAYGGTSVYDQDCMFVIGNNDLVNSRWWAGRIDEVRLTTSVLSEAWIDAEYRNQNDPDSFYSVSSQRSTQDTWSDTSTASLEFTTSSTSPVTMDILVTMDISGSGQTLNSEMNPGTDYFIESGSSVVNWTGQVMVSPPAGASNMGFTVEYPTGEWKPTKVLNPLGEAKALGSDWWYSGGYLTINSSSIDFWGLWTVKFISMNFVEDLQLGVSGGPLGYTATFNIGDSMKFLATTPTYNGAQVGFVLSDPSGSVWYQTSNTTTSDPDHKFPSFKYHKDLVIADSAIYDDMVNYPILVQFLDTDLHDPAKVNSDGSDIMFAMGEQVLAHEIEFFDPDFTPTQASITAWVLANLTDGMQNRITMYYGSDILDNLENPEEVWSASGHEAVYHLGETVVDESSGGVHYDSSGNAHHATQYGNNEVSGKAGFCQEFDGTNDQILAPDTLNPSGDLAISGWFRLATSFSSSSPTSYLIIEKYLSDDADMHIGLAGQDYNQGSVDAGSLVFKVESETDESMYKWTTTTSWNAGWHHFVCTIDSSNPSNNKIFINGWDRTGGSTGSATWASLGFTADWGIGGGDTDSQFPGKQGWFPGRIDEIRISRNVDRSSTSILTEWFNQNNANNWAVPDTEVAQASPDHTATKLLDATAPAGLWTATAYYNDSGSHVTNKTGLFERAFTVKHDSTLTLNKPTDAVGDRITVKDAGDSVILEYELQDDITLAGITGATVTMNWTSPSTITLDEYGGGRYGAVLDTNDLADAKRWRVEVDSTHPFYNDASEYFYIDLYHDTRLDYTDVSTTPIGEDFTATLEFTDTYAGSPIAGATITFGDDSPVNVVSQGGGLYEISISTTGLSLGDHVFTLKATKPSTYMNTATVDITVTIREHFTSISVSGPMTVPYGENLPLHVVLLDMDTGAIVDIGDVDHFNFTSSEGEEIKQFLFTYDMTLTTDTWDIGVYAVTLRVVISDADYYQPEDYQFDVTIRAHKTAVSVVGSFVQPYGNTTPLTVILTDLDTGSTLGYGDVDTLTFTWPPSGSQVESSLSSLDVTLDTSSWAVGQVAVVLAVSMSSSIYQNPSSHQFTVTIRSMSVAMYHDPASLFFAIGDDFTIDLRLNVSEQGSFFGDPVTGRSAGEFSVPGYVISIDTTDQTVGRYGLTIDSSYFAGGFYEIVVHFNSNDARYEDTSLTIRFRYTDIATFLSSPNFPQVTTPYNLNLEIILNYTQAYSGEGIVGATIDSPDHSSWIINWTNTGGGIYSVWINVTGFSKGTYYLNLTASKANHETKELEFRIVVREAFTSAVPSVGSLTIPIGNSPTFVVDFTDIDRLVPIGNESVPYTQVVSDWGNFSVVYLPGSQQYQITFHTSFSDTISQNQVYYFTFSKGSNYKTATFTISVSIRTHNTDFRLVSSIAPVSTIGTFTISVYYGDLDSAVGIRSGLVDFYVENSTGLVVSSYAYDDVSGDGFYLIYVDADQFGLGLQTFTVYADWTGVVAVYQDKNFVTTATVVGRESSLTLLEASDPTPYGEEMSYVFFFSDTGVGIDNLTGNVYVFVAFPTETVDLGQVTISDLSATQPGNYSVSFNTNIFDRIGLIYMNVFVNWSKGVAPFYNNRTDTVSVRVLSRDTLLSISPPSPVSWGEMAEFTLTWEDIVGTGVPITDDAKLTLSMNVTFGYSESGGTFTITLNTSQFTSLGLQPMSLSITWTGSPFYANRTGRIVFMNVLARLTSLEYLSPAPTQYLDEVQFNVTWYDVTGGSTRGITGATLELFLGATPVDSGKYSYVEIYPGVYEVTLNSTFVANPGAYPLRAELVQADFYILDVQATRNFDVRSRITLLFAEPIARVPHNASMEVIVYYQDLFTSDVIANDSGDGYPVAFEILSSPPGGTWFYNIDWQPTFGYYVLTIETWNHGYDIDTPYMITLNMSYAVQSPFYAPDALVIEFRFRQRESTLSIDTPPENTPFGFDTTFTVQFTDDDDGDAGIDGASIYLEYNSNPLTEGVDYNLTTSSGGFYIIVLETDVLGGLGPHDVFVEVLWSGVPYYVSASVDVTVILRQRETTVEITAPPSQTKYLDDIVFTFVYTDLDSDVAITAIGQANVLLYFSNGTPVGAGYTVTPSGSAYTVTIPSTLVTSAPQSGLELDMLVDWDIGTAPYYADGSTTLRVTIAKRTMLVSPNQIDRTPNGDMMTIAVTVTDTDTDNPVSGAIILFSCQNDTLQIGVSYWLSEDAGVYTITVDTTWLTFGTGNYLFDIAVHWDPVVSPFYANKSAITLTGLVDDIYTSVETGAPQPSTQQVTGQVWLLVTFRDLDHSSTVPSATITATYESGGIPVGRSVAEISPGVYNLSFYTDGLDPEVGTYQLNILAERSGYDTASVQVTFSVTSISTKLTAFGSVVSVDWGTPADVAVNYTNLLIDDLIPGANVFCSYQGVFLDSLLEGGTPGVYEASIDTTSLGAGTRVIVVTASKEDFVQQIVTITLVINPLPSKMEPITPGDPVATINKGSDVSIEVELLDEFDMPISNTRVILVTATLEGYLFPLSFNGLTGYWEGSLAGDATKNLEIGISYSVRILATFNQSYDPASYSFQLYVEEAATQLALVGVPTNRIEVVYTDTVAFSLNFTAPDFNQTIENATVFWYQGVNDWTTLVNFTHVGNGIWNLTFDTSLGNFGTWGLVFRGEPTNSTFRFSQVSLTLVIKKIPTSTETPVVAPEVIWGWSGNISVNYTDTYHGSYVAGASVTYDMGNQNWDAVDLGNGTYLIFFDSMLYTPRPGSRVVIYVTFQLQNYDERTAGFEVVVNYRPTEAIVTTPGYPYDIESLSDIDLPMGDTLNVTIFYNDTSPIGGFAGGISGINVSLSNIFAGPGFPGQKLFSLTNLGGGYYCFIFDSMDPEIYNSTLGVPVIYEALSWDFTVNLGFQNRTSQQVIIRIEIIEVPTELVYVGQTEITLTNGETIELTFFLNDTWHNRGVEGASITTPVGGSARVVQGSNISLGEGWYQVTVRAIEPQGDTILNVEIHVEFYESVVLTVIVDAEPNDMDVLISQFTNIGLPIMIVLFTILGLYVKVWSVPKRIRQINGQIKNLRKGKVPKAVPDVKSRQQLIAGLFNDTYEKMEITRTAAQMPEESVPIDVPELGELLMQLAILTNLSEQELEEFKSDISKMKVSEQAAFVKEVIMQEAIRVARREGKTVEEAIADVEVAARRRLGGEEELAAEKEAAVERVFLDDEGPEEVTPKEPTEDVEPEVTPEVEEPVSERMSPHEIEELRRELEKKGVPPHEIDTIIEQARTLPRELVEELVKSLEDGKE